MVFQAKRFRQFIAEQAAITPAADDELYVRDIDGGIGEDKITTVTNLAASAAFTGAYAPHTPIVVTSRMFGPSSGSPSEAQAPANRRHAWALDAAVAERLQAMVAIPTNWNTIDVDIHYANAGAGTGAVAFRAWYQSAVDGTDISGFPSALGTVTPTASTLSVEKVVRVATAATFGLAGAGGVVALHVDRDAAVAGDTLANDVWLYAVVLTRAS